MSFPLMAELEWLPGDLTWWIAGAGLAISVTAYLVGTRLMGSTTRPPVAPAVPNTQAEPDPFESGSSNERRQACRRKGSCVNVHITDDEQRQSRDGWLIDRSVSGLGVWSDRPSEPGTLLKVRPEHAPSMTPWVEVEVHFCKPHEHGWHLGCSYRKTPPYSVLLLFQ